MDLSRIGGGVYRLTVTGEREIFLSGKLHHAIQTALSMSREYRLEYLAEKSGVIFWKEVNVETHQHYHGQQMIQLLKWFFELGCGLSGPGYKRFERIVGISAGRIQDALRRPDSLSHKPLSSQAMLYIEYKVNEFLSNQPQNCGMPQGSET